MKLLHRIGLGILVAGTGLYFWQGYDGWDSEISLSLDTELHEAKEGDPRAERLIGLAYLTGEGAPLDGAKAAIWFQRAARQRDSVAAILLSLVYKFGRGLDEDEAKAREWSQTAEAETNPGILFSIALLHQDKYLDKRGVFPADPEEAIRWFTKAAERQHAESQVYLSVAYKNGIGVPMNVLEAEKWHAAAEAQSDLAVLKDIAYMYDRGETGDFFGVGIPPDARESFKWALKAAEKGDFQSQYAVGLGYEEGIGVEKNEVEAVKWYEKAVQGEWPHAQYRLGSMCERGAKGLPQDAERAAKLYAKASPYSPWAQVCLAQLYLDGRGIEKNPMKAVELYREAAGLYSEKHAREASVHAKFALSLLYEGTMGIPKDDAASLKWCKAAAEQGSGLAQKAMAERCKNGRGVPKNEGESKRWLSLATAQGVK